MDNIEITSVRVQRLLTWRRETLAYLRGPYDRDRAIAGLQRQLELFSELDSDEVSVYRRAVQLGYWD